MAYGAGVKCVPPEIAQLVKPVTAIQLDTMPRKWPHDAWPSGPVLHAREEGEADGRLQMSRTAVIGGGRSAALSRERWVAASCGRRSGERTGETPGTMLCRPRGPLYRTHWVAVIATANTLVT